MNDTPNQQASPARGRGRGRGRNTGKAAAAKAAIKKPATGRRGRQKLYEAAKPQAALERQRELKAVYAPLASALVPALADLADRTIDLMTSDPQAHEKVGAFQEVQSFLDGRSQDQCDQHDRRLTEDLRVVASTREISREIAENSFHVSLPVLTLLSGRRVSYLV